MTIHPLITEVDEGKRLEWLGRLALPGIFDGDTLSTLRAVGENWARITQAEEFSGFLVSFTRTMLERICAGFEAMNEALRLRA
jgi:hypothetical protein